MNCKHFQDDLSDPLGVGGTCLKENKYSFIYYWCEDFNEFEDKNYKCPICHQDVKEQFCGMTGTIVSCSNFCLENQEDEYALCPVCKKGYLSIEKMHGTQYMCCDNKFCNFEMKTTSIITVLLKGMK